MICLFQDLIRFARKNNVIVIYVCFCKVNYSLVFGYLNAKHENAQRMPHRFSTNIVFIFHKHFFLRLDPTVRNNSRDRLSQLVQVYRNSTEPFKYPLYLIQIFHKLFFRCSASPIVQLFLDFQDFISKILDTFLCQC